MTFTVVLVPSPSPGDVAGSVEVLESLLTKHQPLEFQFKIISSGVGNVTEADIELAHGTQGMQAARTTVETFYPYLPLQQQAHHRLLQHDRSHCHGNGCLNAVPNYYSNP